MGKKYLLISAAFFVVAISLRIFLCWYNPPLNAFDDHFKPTFLILEEDKIPSKDACSVCYHPPLFYYVSAIIAKVALKAGMNLKQSLMKLLQFVNCFYGILTLVIIFLILNKLKFSDFSKIIAFGTICFLPRHIYMSAVYSNDAMSYLFVSLCAYLLLITIERKFSLTSLMVLSILMTITLFIRYTDLVVIPMVIVTFTMAYLFRIVVPRKKAITAMILVLLMPALLFGIYMNDNFNHYGIYLPYSRVTDFAIAMELSPSEAEVNFFNFKPWEYIKTPFIAPGQISSFWTLIYSGMWFDTEPRFISSLNRSDRNTEWWKHYYRWAVGLDEYPKDGDPLSFYTHFLGRGLLILGFIPLYFSLVGVYRIFTEHLGVLHPLLDRIETTKILMFFTLLLFNFLGIVIFVLRAPIFSSMKASYVLNSISCFSILIAMGIMYIEKYTLITKVVLSLFLIIFLLCILHIIQIIYGIHVSCFFHYS